MAWSHRGFDPQHLDMIDLFLEIACARHNCSLLVPDTEMPHEEIFQQGENLSERWNDIATLYATEFPQCLGFEPPQRVVPSPKHSQDWQALLEKVPSASAALHGLFQPLVRAALDAAASTSSHLPHLYDYSAAVVCHEFPDKRALAVFQSHFLLLIEFTRLDNVDGHSDVFLVQGVVRASQRANLLHYPMFIAPASTTLPFSLISAECSCKAGSVSTWVASLYSLILACRKLGACSHMQALLLALISAKKLGSSDYVRHPCFLGLFDAARRG